MKTIASARKACATRRAALRRAGFGCSLLGLGKEYVLGFSLGAAAAAAAAAEKVTLPRKRKRLMRRNFGVWGNLVMVMMLAVALDGGVGLFFCVLRTHSTLKIDVRLFK